MKNYDGNLDFQFRDQLAEFDRLTRENGDEEKIYNCLRRLWEWEPDVAEVLRDNFWKSLAYFVAQFYSNELSEKEFGFLQGPMLQNAKTVTEKQSNWIRVICGRLGVE